MSDVDYSDKARFAKGVAIIYAAQPDACVHAEHDQVWFGFADSTLTDRHALESLGWFEDEGSWSFFT